MFGRELPRTRGTPQLKSSARWDLARRGPEFVCFVKEREIPFTLSLCSVLCVTRSGRAQRTTRTAHHAHSAHRDTWLGWFGGNCAGVLFWFHKKVIYVQKCDTDDLDRLIILEEEG
jgi:hypothetical protein